jgi:predicted nucleotide-binding protein
MAYYHVIIKNISKVSKETDIIVDLNRSEQDIKEKISIFCNRGQEFNYKGRRIDPNYVDLLNINKSKEPLEASDAIFISEAFNEGNTLETILDHLETCDVTDLFINGQPEPKEELALGQDGAVALAPRSKNIFIVHGNDHAPMKELKTVLYELGLNPIVLDDKPSGGSNTLIEKLERYSNVDFAFIILTPDDIGGSYAELDKAMAEFEPPFDKIMRIEELLKRRFKTRARQNVILEFGYFIAKLGRNRVCCLYKGSVDFASDMRGVMYIPFDRSVEDIRLKIMKELKDAGYDLTY